MKKSAWRLVILLIVLSGAAGTAALYYGIGRSTLLRPTTLPSPLAYQQTPSPHVSPLFSPAQVNSRPAISPLSQPLVTLPAEVNLAIPFTAQAPHRNWELPYQEFCEEASVLMAMSYVQNQAIPNADFANQRLLEIQAFEEKRFGYYEDTTVEETAIILREYYKNDRVDVAYEPTIQDIKEALGTGKVVIVPAAGRSLPNPYYRQPGPLYHMLVIKGYTQDGKFITNDPGTRNGADFIYEQAVLLNAVHDWNNGQVEQGRKAMIIVG
ncbi:MAG: C39 family peptidase [Candidatus Andersenbacteria bacterium]